MVVEVDAMPGGYVCSASMKGRLGEDDVKRCLAGERSIRKLFSKEQRAFYAAHAPEGLELDDLTLLGPIFVLKLKFTPAELRAQDGRRDVAVPGRLAHPRAVDEVPAGGDVPGRGRDARVSSSGQGVDLTGEQQTKTATALKFFAEQLQAS